MVDKITNRGLVSTILQTQSSEDTRICIICKAPLSNNDMAVTSHLRKHVRNNELEEKDRSDTLLKILGRTRRESTQ